MGTRPKKGESVAALKKRVAELEGLLAEQEKKTKTADNGKDTWHRSTMEAREELNQIHNFIDCLPDAAPRKVDNEDGYGKRDNCALARLAGWLGRR